MLVAVRSGLDPAACRCVLARQCITAPSRKGDKEDRYTWPSGLAGVGSPPLEGAGVDATETSHVRP